MCLVGRLTSIAFTTSRTRLTVRYRYFPDMVWYKYHLNRYSVLISYLNPKCVSRLSKSKHFLRICNIYKKKLCTTETDMFKIRTYRAIVDWLVRVKRNLCWPLETRFQNFSHFLNFLQFQFELLKLRKSFQPSFSSCTRSSTMANSTCELSLIAHERRATYADVLQPGTNPTFIQSTNRIALFY